LSNTDAKTATTFGFLTVIEHSDHGLFGGYLVLSPTGRPVEFHCTAPLKSNRAQEILYGPTLEPFLYGEQIGGSLLGQAESRPVAVYTDCEAALAAREHVSTPVALVLPSEDQTVVETPDGVDGRILRVDGVHNGRPNLVTFQLGRNRLALPERHADDRELITQRMATLGESFDLMEPFGRIREAIEEAQKSVR
jgi:hypothetical protein